MRGMETELDGLERELLAAADTWFSAALHRKLQRLVEIARLGQSARVSLGVPVTSRYEDAIDSFPPFSE